MDLDNIIENYKKNFVSINKHPFFDLYILNYTKKASKQGEWNDTTLESRGVIFNDMGEIISSPFRKFFEYDQLSDINIIPKDTSFKVYEKIDGSLGILYWWGDKPYIATRGSFISYQAVKASQILHEKYESIFHLLNKDMTYLFEIVIPECRVVVNYGNLYELFLIGVINNNTGENMTISDYHYLGFPQPLVHDEIKHLQYHEIIELNQINKEGYVLIYENGFRLKVKLNSYKKEYSYYTYSLRKKAIELVLNSEKAEDYLIFAESDRDFMEIIIPKIKELKYSLSKEETITPKKQLYNRVYSSQYYISDLEIRKLFLH